MSSPVTESDLLRAIAESLPREMGPGEFSINDWQTEFGLTRSLAQSQIGTLLDMGVIERLPERRLQHGHLTITYRKAAAA
jgi:hypothetical protein